MEGWVEGCWKLGGKLVEGRMGGWVEGWVRWVDGSIERQGV